MNSADLLRSQRRLRQSCDQNSDGIPQHGRPNQLTVIIPCKNERDNIRPCVESVCQVADEILVADSGSTDGTLEVVRILGGCRIIEREFVHYGDFQQLGHSTGGK